MKFGQFITKKLKELPKWEEFFLERVSSVSCFLNMIKNQKFEDLALTTFQFLSDVIVHCLNPQQNISNSPLKFYRESETIPINDESEGLLITINAQSERIAMLNKQISEAMISSKKLLCSPLVPVINRELRTSKSISHIPINSTSAKPLFSTPERSRFKREIILETNVDEELSGKPIC